MKTKKGEERKYYLRQQKCYSALKKLNSFNKNSFC